MFVTSPEDNYFYLFVHFASKHLKSGLKIVTADYMNYKKSGKIIYY